MSYYLPEGILIAHIDEEIKFLPEPDCIDSDIIAAGGKISSELLIDAYSKGIFPWYSEPPAMWYSPLKRFVIFPDSLHIPKSLKKVISKNIFTFTIDSDFETVIRNCSTVKRPFQSGTWITEDIIASYCGLHKKGYAHSVEVYFDNKLCGGLYGVRMGSVFCGESMFTLYPDASKAGFAVFADALFKNGFKLIDCQVYTDNLKRFGAVEIERKKYLDILKAGIISGEGDFSHVNISSASACLLPK